MGRANEENLPERIPLLSSPQVTTRRSLLIYFSAKRQVGLDRAIHSLSSFHDHIFCFYQWQEVSPSSRVLQQIHNEETVHSLDDESIENGSVAHWKRLDMDIRRMQLVGGRLVPLWRWERTKVLRAFRWCGVPGNRTDGAISCSKLWQPHPYRIRLITFPTHTTRGSRPLKKTYYGQRTNIYWFYSSMRYDFEIVIMFNGRLFPAHRQAVKACDDMQETAIFLQLFRNTRWLWELVFIF